MYAFCLLFCGKFISKKRPLDLVGAVQRLLGDGATVPPIHLIFVGSGELGAELRAACNICFDAEHPGTDLPKFQPGKPSSSFAGFLNQGEIVRAYVAADCLVLPSDTGETWGLVVNEAMATGLPCIASDQCGSAEDLVLPLAPKGVFPMGDLEALATAIQDRTMHPISPDSVRLLVAEHDIDRTVAAAIQAMAFPDNIK